MNSIEKISGTGHYISIEGSFGGSQGWFDDQEIIKKQGCGLIALSDLVLYLASLDDKYSSPLTQSVSMKKSISKSEYIDFVKSFNKRYVNLHIALNINISLFGHKLLSVRTNNIDGRMGKILNRYFSENGIKLKARWCLTNINDAMTKRIKNMLSSGIPAIIAVGPPLSGKMKGVACYALENGIYKPTGQMIADHYFTVTAVIESSSGRTMYQVSSWGRKYYVHADEIKKFGRRNLSLFTNVLLIKSTRSSGA